MPFDFVQVPSEIWFNIAQFLSAKDLENLLSLNKTFYELAMECRYRQIIFSYYDDRLLRTLASLESPSVAKRVRILHVYPHFLLEAREKEEKQSQRKLLNVLTDIANRANPFNSSPTSFKTAEEFAGHVVKVLKGLPNITEYYVNWCGAFSDSTRQSAVSIISTVFQASLRKLCLEISVENIPELFEKSFNVPNLEELQLTIHTETCKNEDELSFILSAHLAPAINRLRSTLRILRIQSWIAADLSPMLSAIENLFVLEQLTIGIPVEPNFLGKPEGFARFLMAHRCSLHTLVFRGTQLGLSGSAVIPSEKTMTAWIEDAIRNVRLPNLRALDISSPHILVSASIAILQQLSRTLTSLALTGNYRTYLDAVEALDLVSRRARSELEGLTQLRISLFSLDPQVLRLISSKLPGLLRLELNVKYILPTHDCRPLLYNGKQSLDQIEDFLYEVKKWKYSSKIEYISVHTESLPDRNECEPLLEDMLKSCLKSVKTFNWGTGTGVLSFVP